MTILGIETSCDETAAGIVSIDASLVCTLHANAVLTSMDLHAAYGGVVPEIAAREHVRSIHPVIEQALTDANMTWNDIDAIAVTYGAGLGGSLLVGVLTARTLAILKKKPLYAVNHVEGHAYANFLTRTTLSGYDLPKEQPTFPALALIVTSVFTNDKNNTTATNRLALWTSSFDRGLYLHSQRQNLEQKIPTTAAISLLRLGHISYWQSSTALVDTLLESKCNSSFG